MSDPLLGQSDVARLPDRCGCQGDGATWADTSACPVHDESTSPLARAVRQAYEDGKIASKISWYQEALRTIRGPADSGPFIDAYRKAGGGYEGLQAIAREALGDA